jgi:hypothetical protein
MSLFRGVHAPNGQKQQIDFSCVPEIFLYVPQIKLKAFPFPFLACNIDTLDQEFIGWSDPSNSYDFWVSSFEQKLTVSLCAHQSNMPFHLYSEPFDGRGVLRYATQKSHRGEYKRH